MGIDPIKDAPRRQHYYFAHQYLRDRAQEHPKLLIDKLRTETGSKYLGALWVSRGFASKADSDPFIPVLGLSCVPIDFKAHYGALVQLPTPQRVTEAYFVAILLPLFPPDSTASLFYTLEFTKNIDGQTETVLGHWARDAHFNLGPGPVPEREPFLGSLSRLLERITR